jgi:hypothetical protein
VPATSGDRLWTALALSIYDELQLQYTGPYTGRWTIFRRLDQVGLSQLSDMNGGLLMGMSSRQDIIGFRRAAEGLGA